AFAIHVEIDSAGLCWRTCFNARAAASTKTGPCGRGATIRTIHLVGVPATKEVKRLLLIFHLSFTYEDRRICRLLRLKMANEKWKMIPNSRVSDQFAAHRSPFTAHRLLLLSLHELLGFVQPTLLSAVFVCRCGLDGIDACLHRSRSFAVVAETRVRAAH